MKSLQVDGRFNAKIGRDEWSAFTSVKHRRKAEAKDVCDTPNDQVDRVIVRKMNAPFMQFSVAQDDIQSVRDRRQNQWDACAVEKEKMGMTPTPPRAGNETARRRAHRPLVRNPTASRTLAVVALTNEPRCRPDKIESEIV
jgi:hypothetical protein